MDIDHQLPITPVSTLDGPITLNPGMGTTDYTDGTDGTDKQDFV